MSISFMYLIAPWIFSSLNRTICKSYLKKCEILIGCTAKRNKNVQKTTDPYKVDDIKLQHFDYIPLMT